MVIRSSVKTDIYRKLGLITLISMTGMIITLFLFHHAFVSSLTQEKKSQSQRLSDAALGIIKHFHRLVQTQTLDDSQARRMAMNAIQSATFGEEGYFWINDQDGVLLMHPYQSELVGRQMFESIDIKGNYPFRDIVKTALAGGGWVDYYWPKPEGEHPYRKISYVVFFKPWNWVLGTGLYLDDMELEIRTNSLRAMSVVFVSLIALVLVSMMLTEKFMKQLESLAIRDQLTSLYTRRYLNECIEDFILNHDRNKDNYLSVIFLDIDRFKNINDTHGHSCGDEVLASIGGVIKNITRPSDLCVRYGGEEFVIVVLDEIRENAKTIAERIRRATQESVFTHKGIEFSVTLSAGIAVRQTGESFEKTLHRADQKLYQAKANGRDCIVV